MDGRDLLLAVLRIFLEYKYIFSISTAWKVSKYRVFSGLYFSTLELNTDRCEVPLRIQSECGKIRTRKNSVFEHFSRIANYIWQI